MTVRPRGLRWRHGGGARAAASAARRVRAISPPPSRTCSRISSATSWAAAARRRSRGRASRGSDLRYNLWISLEDAYSGLQKQINVPTAVACGSCTAPAPRADRNPSPAPPVPAWARSARSRAFFTVERTCPTCSGVGQIVKNPCKTCGGAGRVQKDRALNVNIPAGVETGTRIRLSGEGEAGLARRAGGRSLHLHRVEDHRCSSATAWTSTAVCPCR
jgi:DnaJ-class molecular chaperone